jgi:hypothetical protein
MEHLRKMRAALLPKMQPIQRAQLQLLRKDPLQQLLYQNYRMRRAWEKVLGATEKSV